jgi:hypothetical protein
MEVVMEPLQGLTVPCEPKDVVNRWKRGDVLETIQRRADANQLPPHFKDGYPGILHDLEQIGVLEERSDHRINLPDLYRVKFGLRRKGGVRPAQ